MVVELVSPTSTLQQLTLVAQCGIVKRGIASYEDHFWQKKMCIEKGSEA